MARESFVNVTIESLRAETTWHVEVCELEKVGDGKFVKRKSLEIGLMTETFGERNNLVRESSCPRNNSTTEII